MTAPPTTLTLAAFVEARIAETEALARPALGGDQWQHRVGHTDQCDWWGDMPGYCSCKAAERVLARCAADRRLVEHAAFMDDHAGATDYTHGSHAAAQFTLRALASVHADHPDWREEWAL